MSTAPLCLGLAALLVTTVPAIAGYGAAAYDQESRKYGIVSDQESQQHADEAALRQCGSERCKVRFGVPPKMCAAFAMPETGPAWGGAVRKSIDDAKFAAVKNCQKHAKAKCAVRESKCNK